MGYLESIFERIETEVSNPTVSNIQDWLSGQGTAHQKKRSGYRNVSIQLAEPFNIREELEPIEGTFEDAPRLRALKRDVGAMEIKDQTTITIFEDKLRISEQAEEEEVTKQEEIRTERIAKEQLLREWKEAETVEEEEEARKLLKAELPSSLRSAKGWRTQEGKEAFRFVFG